MVERVGAGVKEFKPGDRVVYGSGTPGAYADLRNMPADRLSAIPQGIDEEEAAAIVMKGMTVEYLLNRCYFTRPTLATYCSARPDMLASAAKVFELYRAGKLKANIGKRYALSDAPGAHADLESGKTVGASLLVP